MLALPWKEGGGWIFAVRGRGGDGMGGLASDQQNQRHALLPREERIVVVSCCFGLMMINPFNLRKMGFRKVLLILLPSSGRSLGLVAKGCQL